MPHAEPAQNPAVLSVLIANLFEPGVVAAELRADPDAALLYPLEAAACARFAPKRLAEYAAGRLCARRALAELGITGFPIVANADRSPRWPSTVVGSITHTDRFCAAVVGAAHVYGGIGLDAETIGRITPQIRPLIFTPRETELLDALDDAPRAQASTIVFSAKEAFYKCQYAVTQAWRDFHDVWVELLPPNGDHGDFIIHPSPTTGVTDWGLELPLRGRFIVDGQLVITGISVPAFAPELGLG